MKEIAATVTSKGQVTIPIAVRQHLGLNEGDKLVFIVTDTGLVELKVPKYPTVASVRGAAGSLDRPRSWKEMRDIAYEDRVPRRVEES